MAATYPKVVKEVKPSAAVLKDGGSIWIRAIRPSDKPLLVDLFNQLGPQSFQFRFFRAKKKLTDEELSYLTDADFDAHIALVAVLVEEGEERVVGVGHCSRINGRKAEVALIVADEHQGRGIGTLLLERVVRIAHDSGIEEIEAEVLAENVKMLDVFTESGLSFRKSMEDGVFQVVFPTTETEAFIRASTERERRASAESVRVFFEPASVAVIGASRRRGTIGRAIVANLKRCGFRGHIYPVNPVANTIEGLRCFRRVAAIRSRIDLAIVAVPAAAVEEVISECSGAGVRGVVVISSGFAEISEQGRFNQDRIRRLVRSSGMRMVGPNCMGVLNTDPRVSLNATFAPSWPPAGNISILSQSGALGLAMLDHAEKLNIGIASFVSVGNKADVSGNDLLSYWAEDPQTKVIALYLESFGNPRKFARIAPEVARKKPIVAVKSGRSAAGTRAASSHSAALASLDVGVDALFAQAGVIRTNTLEELFDVVALLSTQPIPGGPGVGVVTNAGGPGILLADACEAHGLLVPNLAADTVEQLRRHLPPQAGLSNPVDMIASATPENYAMAINAVGNDPSVDSLVVIYIPPLVTKPEAVAEAIARAAGAIPSQKPIVTAFMSSKGAPDILSRGPRGRIPSYSFPENAAIALASAVRFGRWRDRPPGNTFTLERGREVEIRRIIERLKSGSSEPFWVPLGDLVYLLKLAGISFAPSELAPPEPGAAVAAAERLGYPLVAKAVASGLIHKSDVGGVILGVNSARAVRRVTQVLADRLRKGGYSLDGIILQRQIQGGVEALVGVTTDASLGPLLVAGLGGVQVELSRDVAFRLPPVSDVDVEEMLAGLRAAKLLERFRGAPPADRDALIDLIKRVSALVEVIPELLELELNPVKVLERGQGAVAVDARLRIATTHGRPS